MASVIKVETFDVDVGATGSTHTLTNDVGNLNAAFIRRPGPSDKASGGPTGSTGNANPVDAHMGIEFTGTNQLTFRKGSATTQKIIGEVWRYTGAASGLDEFIVRAHTSVTVTGTSASIAVPGIVDRNKCVPFITGLSTTNNSVSNYEGATFAAHIDASNNLVVSRNNSSGGSHTVYVDVVEFTGSRWRVGHGISTSHDANVETVTLNTDSTGTGGSTFSVNSWNNTFIEASMEGDSSETGLSDCLCVVTPGITNDTVAFSSVYGDGNARNDGDGYVHVVENSAMGVTREEIVSISEGNGTYGTVGFPFGSPTNRSIDEIALEWMVDTSGTGTAHARGRLNARIINATGTVQHWVHRSGNDVDVAYGLIDLTLVDGVLRPNVTNIAPPFFVNPGTISVITGENFGAVQGTGKVELSDNAAYGVGTLVEQTVTSWSDTSIDITSVHTGLSNGIVYLFVTDDAGETSVATEHTLGIKTYGSFIDDLIPDHRWSFDGDYSDVGQGGLNRPANNNVSGSPSFTANPLCRGVTQSVLINALGEGFAMANSTNMNDGTQVRRTMHGWIMVTDVLTALTAIYEEGGSVNNAAILIGFGNILMGQVADTGDFYIQAYSDFKLEPNRPYHVVWRFGASSASNTFTMFVDGQEVSVTKGNPVGASDLDSHTGDISWGDPDSLEVGGTDVLFASPVGCRYNEWASWRVELGDSQISGDLFQAGMTSLQTLSADTGANMQIALDALASTDFGNWPCALEIEAPTDSPDLTLVADDITFNPGCTYDIQWQGSGTLTWINQGTSNASKASTFLSAGTVEFVQAVPITVTVRDIDTKLPVEGARVLLETDPGGLLLFNDLTDVNGQVTTEFVFDSGDTNVLGRVRRGTVPPYYKGAPIVGTITENGLTLTIFVVGDE
jgi:hypothetical protein